MGCFLRTLLILLILTNGLNLKPLNYDVYDNLDYTKIRKMYQKDGDFFLDYVKYYDKFKNIYSIYFFEFMDSKDNFKNGVLTDGNAMYNLNAFFKDLICIDTDREALVDPAFEQLEFEHYTDMIELERLSLELGVDPFIPDLPDLNADYSVSNDRLSNSYKDHAFDNMVEDLKRKYVAQYDPRKVLRTKQQLIDYLVDEIQLVDYRENPDVDVNVSAAENTSNKLDYSLLKDNLFETTRLLDDYLRNYSVYLKHYDIYMLAIRKIQQYDVVDQNSKVEDRFYASPYYRLIQWFTSVYTGKTCSMKYEINKKIIASAIETNIIQVINQSEVVNVKMNNFDFRSYFGMQLFMGIGTLLLAVVYVPLRVVYYYYSLLVTKDIQDNIYQLRYMIVACIVIVLLLLVIHENYWLWVGLFTFNKAHSTLEFSNIEVLPQMSYVLLLPMYQDKRAFRNAVKAFRKFSVSNPLFQDTTIKNNIFVYYIGFLMGFILAFYVLLVSIKNTGIDAFENYFMKYKFSVLRALFGKMVLFFTKQDFTEEEEHMRVDLDAYHSDVRYKFAQKNKNVSDPVYPQVIANQTFDIHTDLNQAVSSGKEYMAEFNEHLKNSIPAPNNPIKNKEKSYDSLYTRTLDLYDFIMQFRPDSAILSSNLVSYGSLGYLFTGFYVLSHPYVSGGLRDSLGRVLVGWFYDDEAFLKANKSERIAKRFKEGSDLSWYYDDHDNLEKYPYQIKSLFFNKLESYQNGYLYRQYKLYTYYKNVLYYSFLALFGVFFLIMWVDVVQYNNNYLENVGYIMNDLEMNYDKGG